MGTMHKKKHYFFNPAITKSEEFVPLCLQVFKKLGDAGLLGMNKPEEYGGLGLDFK